MPPVVTGCPMSTSYTVPFGTSTRIVSWIEPTATDDSGLTPTVARSVQPGTLFSLGSTNVEYTFSDRTGNTAMCVFTIVIGKDSRYQVGDCEHNFALNV